MGDRGLCAVCDSNTICGKVMDGLEYNLGGKRTSMMNSWNKLDKEAEKSVLYARKLAVAAFVIFVSTSLGVLGGVGYVAYLLLRHFGII